MRFKLTEIQEICKGRFLYFTNDEEIRYIYTDSRNFIRRQQSVFIAIKGQNNDGHKYIAELIQKGIRNYIVDNEKFVKNLPTDLLEKVNILFCTDSISALQDIAHAHRKRFSIPVSAITGSNGKTIVKEWITQLAGNQIRLRVSPKSFNSQTGVPFSLLTLNANDELAVFEAGISNVGEMEKLARIIEPDTGILTNLGSAHQEGFSSLEQKLREKLILFRNSYRLIYCKDHQFIDSYIQKLKSENFFNKDIELLYWSTDVKSDAALKIIQSEIIEKGRKIDLSWDGKMYSAIIPFIDNASLENAMHSLLFLLQTGLKVEYLVSQLSHLQPVEMRQEIKEGINNCILINDSYNSDINSLAIALDNLVFYGKNRKKTAIISEVFQSGVNPEQIYGQIAHMIGLRGIDRVYGIGKNIKRYSHLFGNNAAFFETTDDFLRNVGPVNFYDEVVLIKGARIFSLEKITAALQKKVHSTILEINLNHLIFNLNYYRSLLRPGTKIMAMVKAFSYGSGNVNVSTILEYNQVDYLGVAYADEGIELINSGIKKPIMVMNPDIDSLPVILTYRLEPEIYSFRLLNALSSIYLKGPYSEKVRIHLKFDTGMHRLGFTLTDIPEIVKIIEKNPYIEVASVFTHLSSAEIAEYDYFTLKQIDTFEQICHALYDSGINGFIRHVLNSAGIVRFTDYQYDMVRLGIGLYGIDITGNIVRELKNVVTFKTIISQIKAIHPGESVGYSRSFIAEKPMLIATIGVGYADGFPRKLGNGKGYVLVRGQKAPVVGNICMDMTMIDVTGIAAEEGEEVIIFGDDLPLSKLSSELETIPYEVLTSISQRVKRVYFRE